MKPRTGFAAAALFAAAVAWAGASLPQEKAKPEDAAAKMMEAWKKAGAVGENHRLLEAYVGEWTTASKMWMDPSAPPEESTGTASAKAIFEGRFVQTHYKGTMMGAPHEVIATSGYDNLKKKFACTWIDSTSTSITTVEGTYDAATKTFTYRGDYLDAGTGGMTPFRYTEKVADKDKILFEWYETREGKEGKTGEVTYTRKK